MVALVSVSAPSGGLGDENLEPLLRVQQDRLYRPLDVRQDIATLFRAGDFRQVEAWAEPWPVLLDNGDQIEGVRVEYRVYATPAIRKLTVTGVRAFAPRALLGEVGASEGDLWRDDDPARLAGLIEARYRAAGWLAAKATVERSFDEDGDVLLSVAVEEGEPRRLTELKVRPNPAISERRVRAVLAREGLAEGRPFTDGALRSGQEALLKELRGWRPAILWWARTWWPEARVNLKLTPLETGGERLSVLIEARRAYTVERDDPVRPRDVPGPGTLVEVMGLDEGARLGRDFAVEASAALTDEERRGGYLDASIEVRAKETDEAVHLVIGGKRGPRYTLRSVRAQGDVVDPDALGSSNPAFFSACVAAGSRRFPGEERKLTQARSREERFLCQATEESARELLPPPPFGRQSITPDMADRAAEEIEEFYRSQGYLSVEVRQQGFETVGARRDVRRDVTVTLDLKAGPRTTLQRVEVSGAVPGIDGAALFAELVGKPINPSTLRERSRRLVEAHQRIGFLHADSRVTPLVEGDGSSAVVKVEVTPGPLVLVRSVIVRGHGRTRRSTIEREIEVRAGDPVSPDAMAEIRRSLYELGVFQRVSVEAVGDEDRVKDVVVAVDEKRNLSFEVGGGIATDNGAAVFARNGHRNLWGLAHRLTLYGRAGVGWIGDGWGIDWLSPEWKLALRYEAPNLPTDGERVAFDLLFNEEQQERSFRIRRSGGGASVSLRLGSVASAELGYKAQLRTLYDVDPGVLVSGDAWLDELGVSDLEDPSPIVPSAARWASGISANFVVDLRDDALAPTRGGLGSVAVEVNDDLLSDIAFVRAEGAWTHLVPVGGLGVILRARGGAVVAPDASVTVPVEDRLRAGGGGSFRGFEVDTVGPANHVSNEDVDWPSALDPMLRWSARTATGRWVPTGGDAMAIGTAEIDVPFSRLGLASWSSWQLAFFTDVGNVWWASPSVQTDSMRRGEDPLVRYGLGFGIRRTTPIGPLQLDLGFNPSALAYREEVVFPHVHFSVGAL